VANAVELPGVFGALAAVLDHYGYPAVAAFVLLEDFGVPLPGETILIAAAGYAGAGRLNVVLLGVLAVVAAVIGDNIGFTIGHFGGRPLTEKYGKYVLLTRTRLDHAEEFVRRHGGWIVTIFVEGLRQANGIVAGIARLPWKRTFLPFNVLGAVLWAGVWITVGYVAGSRIDQLYHKFKHYELYIGIGIGIGIGAGVLVLGLVGYRLFRHHRRERRSARS
jgi:membrane protein DedA with SNARE-associated domain